MATSTSPSRPSLAALKLAALASSPGTDKRILDFHAEQSNRLFDFLEANPQSKEATAQMVLSYALTGLISALNRTSEGLTYPEVIDFFATASSNLSRNLGDFLAKTPEKDTPT